MVTITLDDAGQNVIGKVLAENVISDSGQFLLSKGMTLTTWHLNILKNHNVYSIFLTEPSAPSLNLQIKNVFKNREDVSHLYYENVTEIKKLFHKAITRETPTLQSFMKPFAPLLETVIRGNSIFLELHHIKGFDEYTYRHSINVGLLAATIGKILQYPDEITLLLGKIGFFHDIGKMKVSQQILNKKGSLTEKEYEEVKRHTIYGKELLEKIDESDKHLHLGALYHHERLDGSGYPFGIKDGEIPMLAQVISVADTYDAVSSDRVYKGKVSPFQALEVLVGDVYKGKLNGEIVLPFVTHILNGYVSRRIVLNDGRIGQLLSINAEEIIRPLIKVEEEFVDLRRHREFFIVDVLAD